MRTRVLMTTAALLLASAMYATAQTKPAKGTSATPTGAMTGTVDVGFRATTVDGDEARFERYRDLRDGLYTNISFGKETGTYLYDLTAKNIGYHDQQYRLQLPEQQDAVLVPVGLDPAELLLQLPHAVAAELGDVLGARRCGAEPGTEEPVPGAGDPAAARHRGDPHQLPAEPARVGLPADRHDLRDAVAARRGRVQVRLRHDP